jgi:quinol monooxygenase YgiN
MITEYIRYTLVAHQPAAFIAAYAEAGRHLAAAPECLAYELTQCADDERSFILRIQWASASAHREGFRTGPNFPPFLALIRPFIPEIAEMRHYHAIPDVLWRSPAVIGE